jgi:hypothetical protein|uniref:hypothetical protein n=1 Tax=Fluviicola sp. TaxID=1917219 RepID=UPI00404A7706
MKIKLSLFLLLLNFQLIGQFDYSVRINELKIVLDSLRAAKSDDEKISINDRFRSMMKKTLEEPAVFNYNFSELTSIGCIDSPDSDLRIVNWNVEQEDESQLYFAFVLKRDIKKNKHEVFELTHNSYSELKPAETLDAENWYGALYYKIIPKIKGSKKYYTVLGWNGATKESNMKLIDVISFSGNALKLGAPIFKIGNNTVKRVFFEHSKKVTISLKWEPEYKRIIFDHLSPETPSMIGFFEFYVPDMSYDAFVFEDGKWVLQEDVIGINKASNDVKVAVINPETGEIELVTKKGEWIDPSNGKGSASDTHVPAMPSTSEPKNGKVKKKKENQTALERYEKSKGKKARKQPKSITRN